MDFGWESLRNIARMGMEGVGISDYSQRMDEKSLLKILPYALFYPNLILCYFLAVQLSSRTAL
jgi:hypothetical protein